MLALDVPKRDPLLLPGQTLIMKWTEKCVYYVDAMSLQPVSVYSASPRGLRRLLLFRCRRFELPLAMFQA